MKTMYKTTTKQILLFTGVIIITILTGCSLSDEDFSDIQVIEQIIKKDADQVFGVELANDSNALPEDSLDAFFSRTFKIGTISYSYSLTGNMNQGIFFGRRVVSSERFSTVTLINDTLASAEVTYLLKGDFIIIRPEWSTSKPFIHPVKRYLTFIKRPKVKPLWRLASFTPAFGITDNAEMAVDSVRIVTAYNTISCDNPFDISFTNQNRISLKRGDFIWVEVKAQSASGPTDTIVGFTINGRNRHQNSFRERKLMYFVPPQHFVRLIRIGQNQQDGFNQLVIDFYSLGTIKKIHSPYRSMIISIPYWVEGVTVKD